MTEAKPGSFFKSVVLVGIQFTCLLVLIASGPVFDFRSNAIILEILSILIGLWAILVMQASKLTIFPDLRTGSILIRKGPYRLVRHPMYLAVILFAISLLLTNFTVMRLGVVLILIIDLLLKIEYEEKILINVLDEYSEYKRKTYKLIPLLY